MQDFCEEVCVIPRATERGVTLLLVCILMFAMIAMAALAIDVAWLYTARSEAQRAADAAALAGAKEFLDSGFTSGLITSDQVMPLSRQKAEAVASTNNVAGVAASVADGDVTFDFSRTGDPLITVTVQRSSAAGNPIPTFFARMFGRTAVDVRASATAEAFNPSGTGVPVTASCVKPLVVPNCDPLHGNPANTAGCTGGTFINPTSGAISNPGYWAGVPNSGGVIGEQLQLKGSDPQTDAPVPSQYYPISIPAGGFLCPDASSSHACQTVSAGGTGGAALYRKELGCCASTPIVCGSTINPDYTLKKGNMPTPTVDGVCCLTHEDDKSGTGQDILDTSVRPFQIIGGSNNPDPSLVGQKLSSSASLVTIPIYDGHVLCPGGSCGGGVQVIGFLQLFVNDVTVNGSTKGKVIATIFNVSGCGTTGGGGGGGGGPTGGGASPVPIRLVHT